jgi:hypothetical protein
MISDPQNGHSLGVALEPEGKRLSRAEFQGLGDMPPELEWFANLDNPCTRRAYRNDVKAFTAFAGVERPEEMRQVTRAHLIAWRKDLRYGNDPPENGPLVARQRPLAADPASSGSDRIPWRLDAPPTEASIGASPQYLFTEGHLSFPSRR